MDKATRDAVAELRGAPQDAGGFRSARRLTGTEQSNLRLFFGDALDSTKVRLHTHTFSKDTAFCIDNRIFFPKPLFKADFGLSDPQNPGSSTDDDKVNLAWLFHECCHAWQFQNKVRGYRWYKALLEQIKYGDATYDYDIEEKDCFADYRFEQQGQILQDYVYWYLLEGTHPQGAQRFRTVLACSLPIGPSVAAPATIDRRLPDWRKRLTRY